MEPEAGEAKKQLSFVDHDKFKCPFRSRPQARKTSAQHETTTTSESSTIRFIYFGFESMGQNPGSRMAGASSVTCLERIGKHLVPDDDCRSAGPDHAQRPKPGKDIAEGP